MSKPFTIFVSPDSEPLPCDLDGKTFQLHHLGHNCYRLYPVTITPPDTQCPCLLIGSDGHAERCGLEAGHEGKHTWGPGD